MGWYKDGRKHAVRRGVMGVACAVVLVAGSGALHTCKAPATAKEISATAGTQPASQDLRDNLAELAKGHRDRVQFAWYATTFRRLDPPVAAFAKKMGEENKRLGERLNTWAKHHKMDLTFRYGEDMAGKARRAMEKEQEGVIRGDSGPDFQRDLLMSMWSDYDWQQHLAESTAAEVSDPELKAYLQADAAMLKEGVKEIRALLGRYKFEK